MRHHFLRLQRWSSSNLHVRIHKSTLAVDGFAFFLYRLVYVDTHKELYKIGEGSFGGCVSLNTIDLSRVKIIEQSAFSNCLAITEAHMTEVERIWKAAFKIISSFLRKISAPSVESIGEKTFYICDGLLSAEFGEDTSISIWWLLVSATHCRPLAVEARVWFKNNHFMVVQIFRVHN